MSVAESTSSSSTGENAGAFRVNEVDGLRFTYELNRDSANYNNSAINHRVTIDFIN